VPDDPRQELAGILRQASAYLGWLKDEGTSRVEVALGALPARAPVRRAAGAPPSAASPPARPSRPVAGPRPATLPSMTQGTDMKHDSLEKVAGDVARCMRCVLHKTRTRTVPGQGNPHPEILFVGEAPGADEDEQGLAFVGAAGQLLTRMIVAMGYTREEVFIANILKCRPPNNRQPLPEEMDCCLPFLKRQIARLQPKVIVALGAVAVRGLLKREGISKLRGRWLEFEGIPLMPTYHPAYLLRNPPAKKDVWEDLQTVLKQLGRTPPPR
jgi:DNA polymerase